MKRLGVDLGVLEGTPPPLRPGAPDCPGGMVRVTRYDFDQYTGGGERFLTPRQDIPVAGYGSARILCSNPVAALPKTAAGNIQYYGLCHSCSAAEAKNREDLRERAKVRGDR